MTDAYRTETRTAHGHDWVIEWACDYDSGAPWANEDGHGPVSDWTRRDKLPGEMVLNSDGCSRRYYDFAAAVKQARAEGWNTAPYNWPTKGARAAAAALADFEYLRGWCNDEWGYCGIIVKLDGTDFEASLWGIESTADEYHEEVIADLMAECLHQLEANTYPVTHCGV